MSDQRLRDLERRYRESGAPSDEADFLREAVRAGRLEERLLLIAGDLGHPAARGALDLDPISAQEVEGLGHLLRERWGQWELVNISHALARRVFPAHATGSEVGGELRAALESVAAWLKSPGSDSRSELYRLGRGNHSLEELAAWAGGPAWGVIQAAIWTLTRAPYRGSAKSERAYQAPGLALAILGIEGYLEVVAELMTPRLLRELT